MANVFKNDGSFLEQFLAQQGGGGAGGAPANGHVPPPPPPDQPQMPMDPNMQQQMQMGGMMPGQEGYGYGYYGQGAAPNAYGGYPMYPGYPPMQQPYGRVFLFRSLTHYALSLSLSMCSHQSLIISMFFTGYPGFPGGGGGGFPGGGGGGGPHGRQPTRSVWVGNLAPSVTEGDLRAEFAPFGMIEAIKVITHKGCAFINFVDIEGATRAYNGAGGKVIHDMEIRVGWGKVLA
jgi:hypothetical protein